MAGIQNKLLTGTIIVIHSEKEASVVKSTGNIKENLEKSSEVAPLDGIRLVHFTPRVQVTLFYGNFCCNPVVLKKIGKTSKEMLFGAQFALGNYKRSAWTMPKMTNNFFWQK